MSITEIPPEESTTERPVQAGWWQQFWWRHSPHGELPLSSVASWAIHALVVVLVWVATMTMASRYREPPRVDVVSVGDGNSTGLAGGGDGMPVGGDAGFTTEIERLNQGEEREAPREVDVELPTLPTIEPPKSRLTLTRDPDSNRQIQLTDAAVREASDLLRKVLESNQNRGGGKGSGDGPGTGNGVGIGSGSGPGSGRGSLDANSTPGRQARWIVSYPTLPQGEYERMLDSFHIELAYLDSDRKTLQYLSNLFGAGKIHKGDANSEERMFWYWMGENRLRDLDESIMRKHGLAPSSDVVQLYSKEMELKLAELEKDQLRKQWKTTNVEQIVQTNFRIVPGGPTGWHVEVTNIILR